jgi:hypothetical protein
MPRNAFRLLPLSLTTFLVLTASAGAENISQSNPAPSSVSSEGTGPEVTGGAATTAVLAGKNGNGPAANGPTAPAAASGSSLGDELTDLKRFFTVTLDVREEYNDNIYSASNGPSKIGSFEEIISPSILFSYPMENSTFDARYTFGLTYYNRHLPNQAYDQDHDVVLRYNHAFSDRFNLDLRDDGGYHIDPSLLSSIGATGREGGYYSNIFTGEFTAQWTPLFGTVTSYSNNFISYENSTIGNEQDSDENTISQDFRFAFWPTVTFAAGLIYDDIEYLDSSRGFANYTANAGFDWQALPSLSLGVRVGGSLTEINQGGSSSVSPYASANVNWQLGERSRLIGSYVHTVTPTDVFFAEGEESDRFTANFLYNITERITTHFEGIYSHNDINDEFLTAGGTSNTSTTEDVLSFDTGVTYHYNQYLDFEGGYIFSDVSSQLNFEDYTDNQIYLGIRGTY